MRALTLSEKVAVIRDRLLEEQNGMCPICDKAIERGAEVLDHQHQNGRVRAVLHRQCNSFEGKLANALKRFYGIDVSTFSSLKRSDYTELNNLIQNLESLWYHDYSANPYHPGHRFKEHKRISQLRKEIKKAKMLTTKVRKKEEIKQLQLKIKEKYGNN